MRVRAKSTVVGCWAGARIAGGRAGDAIRSITEAAVRARHTSSGSRHGRTFGRVVLVLRKVRAASEAVSGPIGATRASAFTN